MRSVDLTGRTRLLLTADVHGAVFLGCPMAAEAARRVQRDGALVFPVVPDLPFAPYRGALYTPDELFAGLARGSRRRPAPARTPGSGAPAPSTTYSPR